MPLTSALFSLTESKQIDFTKPVKTNLASHTTSANEKTPLIAQNNQNAYALARDEYLEALYAYLGRKDRAVDAGRSLLQSAFKEIAEYKPSTNCESTKSQRINDNANAVYWRNWWHRLTWEQRVAFTQTYRAHRLALKHYQAVEKLEKTLSQNLEPNRTDLQKLSPEEAGAMRQFNAGLLTAATEYKSSVEALMIKKDYGAKSWAAAAKKYQQAINQQVETVQKNPVFKPASRLQNAVKVLTVAALAVASVPTFGLPLIAYGLITSGLLSQKHRQRKHIQKAVIQSRETCHSANVLFHAARIKPRRSMKRSVQKPLKN